MGNIYVTCVHLDGVINHQIKLLAASVQKYCQGSAIHGSTACGTNLMPVGLPKSLSIRSPLNGGYLIQPLIVLYVNWEIELPPSDNEADYSKSGS